MAKELNDLELVSNLKSYRNWTGSRLDLISLISKVEQVDPKNRMLFTKKAPKKMLPINSRRIQWFISIGIMPKPKGQLYDFSHIVYYWAAIFLRKQKLTFPQIENLSNNMSLDAAEDLIASKNKNKNPNLFQPKLREISDSVSLTSELQSMGRVEGKPLKTNIIEIAITPWCSLSINESETHHLTPENIDVITESIRRSLNNLR